ncbi:hypothetical protein V8E36_003844 [Tilletia maclaganii]
MLVAQGCGRLAAVPGSRTMAVRRLAASALFCRSASTATERTRTRTIAVLGGGITGLTSALVLARRLPQDGRYRIVLVEAQDRLGGWVQSDAVPLASQAHPAVVEGGPRSIRPRGYSGMVLLDLIRSLGLVPRLLSVSVFAPAARNRFIYYPDRLNQLPSTLFGFPKALLTLPPLKGVVPSIASDFFTPSKRWDADEDESVDAFLTRRFGGRAEIPSNLVSAVLHGIYAGDSKQLSIRALMPFLVRAEQQHGSPIRAILPKWLNRRHSPPSQSERLRSDTESQELAEAKARLGPKWETWLKRTSVYSFPRGCQEITDAMAQELRSRPNVELRTGTTVRSISFNEKDPEALVSLSDGSTIAAERIISTLPATALSSSLDSSSGSDMSRLQALLRSIPSVTVGVINVVIPSSVLKDAGISNRLLPVQGFGFLIPRSTPNNEDGILGVVFDSDTFPDQDRAAASASKFASGSEVQDPDDFAEDGQPTRPFKKETASTTKLTVMLGGHWFDKAAQGDSRKPAIPDSQELQARALRSLEKHLGIPPNVLTHPHTRVIARLQRDCIPQYVVGHVQRMREMHHLLLSTREPKLAGRLILTGASYTGVSVNDCVAGADRVARAIAAEEVGTDDGGASAISSVAQVPTNTSRRSVTGLEMHA